MESVECFKGDDWEIEMAILDEDGNIPSGIENYNAIYTLSKRPTGSDENNVIKSDDITLTVSALGIVTGSIPPSITSTIPTGKYYEHIQLVSSNGLLKQTFERMRTVKSVNYIPEVTP